MILRMKIGILGGSFDPPHFGHLLVARQTLEVMGLDEVWLMPYFAHAWDASVSAANDRLAMTRTIEEKGIKVSDIEIQAGKKNYFIDTTRLLHQSYPHEFFWIVGTDIVPEFNRWKEPESLKKEARFLVFPRNGYPVPDQMPPCFQLISSRDLVVSNISSTRVRIRLTKGLSVVGLIPERVLDYINEKKLYGVNTIV
jgi:nicotinate-nucleotide adenylyltransferase